MGFKYEDHECKIRNAFLDSEDCDSICEIMCVRRVLKQTSTMGL